MISIVLVLPVSSSIIDITRKEILEATPCMNEPPKPKCQMGAGDLKKCQMFRDTFPRQLAPEIVMCAVFASKRLCTVASISESRDDLALHTKYIALCWNDAETGYHCTPGSRL